MSSLDDIATAAEAADGASPLDEATRLTLRHHPERVRSWLRDDAFALVIGRDLTLVVHPGSRERGVGGDLFDQVLNDLPRGELNVWSHGDHPAAAKLAASHGFEKVRELWVMRRPTSLPLPDLPSRDDVTIRGFVPGDEAELIRVNAAAFVDHPEQASMDAANLAHRMSEPWFDPAGLLVAIADERMLGFHWTKRHSVGQGEIYVLGIDPAAQGRGLGRLLSLAGMHHLAQLGVNEVLLYVEADNRAGIALYTSLGFTHTHADTHVMYRRIAG